ncbi:MAG: AMP-binding protein [Acidimicrobiales bacterium]
MLALGPEDALTKIGSAGLPAMHVEVRIVDDQGNDVVQGETGELWVRGQRHPRLLESARSDRRLVHDGWLHTGDAARQDDEGYFYVVDRWKDMYISAGRMSIGRGRECDLPTRRHR